MLHSISESSLEDAIQAYNDAPGNKKFENISFLPVQENGVVSIAVVIIYSTVSETTPAPTEVKRPRSLGPFIGQPPATEI